MGWHKHHNGSASINVMKFYQHNKFHGIQLQYLHASLFDLVYQVHWFI